MLRVIALIIRPAGAYLHLLNPTRECAVAKQLAVFWTSDRLDGLPDRFGVVRMAPLSGEVFSLVRSRAAYRLEFIVLLISGCRSSYSNVCVVNQNLSHKIVTYKIEFRVHLWIVWGCSLQYICLSAYIGELASVKCGIDLGHNM